MAGNSTNHTSLADLFKDEPLGFLIIRKLRWQPWMFSLVSLFLAFGVTLLLAWWDGLAFPGEAVKDRIVFLKDPLVYWYKVFLIPISAYLMISIYSRISKSHIYFKNLAVNIELPKAVKRLTTPIIRNIDAITLIALLIVLLILFPTIRRMWFPGDVTDRWHIYWWAWSKPIKLSALWNNLFLYPLMFYFAVQVCFRIFLFSWTMIRTFRVSDKIVMHFHFSDGFGGFKPIGNILLTNYFFLFLTGLSIPINLIIFRSVYKEPLLTDPTVVLLIVIYLVIVIFSFLAPLYYIHRPMAAAKKNELSRMEEIAEKIRAELDQDKKMAAERDLTDKELGTLHRRFETYQSFKNFYDEVKKTKSWPIDGAGLLKSLLMTIIPCVLNLISLSEKVARAISI